MNDIEQKSEKINTLSWKAALKAKYGPEQCTTARKALGLPTPIPDDKASAMARWLEANARPPATEISELHAAALAYAAKGIPIFPCIIDGKAPACPHGHKDATQDVEQINAWWGNADYNIGLEPERIGQCVIDADLAKPGCGMDDLLLPETYVVRTPSGGEHHYFKGSLPPTASKLGKAVDTRGYGSYVLVPPSVVNGKRYEVLHDRDPVELPADIAEQLAATNEPRKAVVDDLDRDANVARARTLLAGCVSRGDVAIEGQGGNNRTYRFAAEVQALGISPETCLRLMAEWNEHCQPPWPADELARIVDNATAYMQNEAGANAVGSAVETFGDAVANLPAIPEPVNVIAPNQINLINPVPFSALMSRPLKPIQEIIPGLIEKGVATMLAGPGGTHKSRLALQWGLSIQAGIPVFGKPVERCTFVYLDYENGADEITRRTHKMQYRLKLPPDTHGHYHDFTGKSAAVSPGPLPTSELSPPVALIEETGITCCPLYFQLFDFLRSIPGHKLVVADSTYNILRFAGQTKINESGLHPVPQTPS